MATHYLSGQQSSLDKALQLLDSGAARASAMERSDQPGQPKPILTNLVLANIVSSWTQIPLSHLQHNKFKAADFIQGMQKHIFGQEAAINLIGLALQHARIKLQTKTGPLCSFLFAGPPNIGKTETAFAMAEQLFGHKGALLRVKLDKTLRANSLAEIKVMAQTENSHFPTLFEAIQQCPYAVVLLENINQAPPVPPFNPPLGQNVGQAPTAPIRTIRLVGVPVCVLVILPPVTVTLLDWTEIAVPVPLYVNPFLTL